jgi:hypothetical protein
VDLDIEALRLNDVTDTFHSRLVVGTPSEVEDLDPHEDLLLWTERIAVQTVIGLWT